MAVSDLVRFDSPQQTDLDKCVHCGLCLNSCPTYRELGVEMDSPRGRIYQMNQVASGAAEINASYLEHMELCLACRACESACPSGVQYGRLIEAARAEIEQKVKRPTWEQALRYFIFGKLLPSQTLLKLAARGMWIYQSLGIQRFARETGLLKNFGRLGRIESLSPPAEFPTFFEQYGKIFPPKGTKRYRVAMLGGCIGNVSFARLNEATVRVLQQNGCEVVVPAEQTCCGALQVHQGMRDITRRLARQNIDAILGGGFDAIITNAAGCGSTLKEYHELLEHDDQYRDKAQEFVRKVKDVTEFLASIELSTAMKGLPYKVTYQDSCHLLHGQKIKAAPRQLLKSIPGIQLREMVSSEICCGSAGVYSVIHDEMAASILENKMQNVNRTEAEVIATANTGCMLQLRTGAARHGNGQRVVHVVELLDEAYSAL